MTKYLECTYELDGVKCNRPAVEFYQINHPPYYVAYCTRCSSFSKPRGQIRSNWKPISEEEAIILSVMEKE
jgi:hypothetical protein